MFNTTWPWYIAIYACAILGIIGVYFARDVGEVCMICTQHGVEAYKNGLHVIPEGHFRLSDGTTSQWDRFIWGVFVNSFLLISFIPVAITYKLSIKYRRKISETDKYQ